MFLDASRRCVQSRADMGRAAIAAWARRLTHFLHLSQVTEPLGSGIETVVWIILEEIERLLADNGLSIHHAVGDHLFL